MRDYFGMRPLHIRGSSGAGKAVDWAGLNRLLAISSHWDESNLKLILNSRPVRPEYYIDDVTTASGPARRPDMAKVDVFLGMGASLVADAVEDISPEIRAVTSALAREFSGRAGANIYCSFDGVQAFASHCDLNEVFAVQCEGEKIWTIYENRAASPVAPLEGDDAQAIIDSAKGGILLRVHMKPGDLLYIPRGFYHDAIAESGASLHITYSVLPHTGRILFRLLEEMAMQDEAFRMYLPDARHDDGRSLAGRLAEMADRLGERMRGPDFAAIVADRQRRLTEPDFALDLPNRLVLEHYARTDRTARVTGAAGAQILEVGEERIALHGLGMAAEWLLGRPAFSIQELHARFRWLDEAEIRALVGSLEHLGLLFPYRPAV